jgi:small subunit ribosomal protein S16
MRLGMKKRPFYRIVVAKSTSPRDGRFIDQVGYYDPMTDPSTVKIDAQKALLWLERGAQPSDTAAYLLKKEGILDQYQARKTGAAPAAAPTAEAPAAANTGSE